jgi:hypothetical protein
MTVFGFQLDAGVEMVFTSLQLQTASVGIAQSPAAYRRTWLVGFAEEVHRRLKAAERNAMRQHDATPIGGPSAALVLADRRSLVDRAFAEQFPNLRRRRRADCPDLGTTSAWQHGVALMSGRRSWVDRSLARTSRVVIA